MDRPEDFDDYGSAAWVGWSGDLAALIMSITLGPMWLAALVMADLFFVQTVSILPYVFVALLAVTSSWAGIHEYRKILRRRRLVEAALIAKAHQGS